MNDMSIRELEDELHAGQREVLGATTLAAIRRRGGRRRTARRAVTGVGAAVLVGAVGLTMAVTGTLGQGSGEAPVAQDPPPKGLSPLAKRALAEVPGARQVSQWQVVLPDPGVKSDYWMRDDDGRIRVDGDPVPLDAKTYQGVTMYPAKAWPAWLYDGTLDHERSQGSDEEGYPVGSLGTGILVESGDAVLVCASWKKNPCGPALMTRTSDGKLHYEWGMGTEKFLTPGSDMEVFKTADYSTGSPGDLAFAGLPGTDVAEVEFVTTTGEVVAGEASTTLVEGASMMWARVPGELAKVVAYDAKGEVIEDHPLKPCDTDVECEVR